MMLTSFSVWFQTKIANIGEYYAEHGLRRSLLHVFERLGLTYSRSKLLIFFELRLSAARFPLQEDARFDFLRIDKDEFERLEYQRWGLTREESLARLEQGHILFIAKDGDRMICQQWIEVKQAELWFLDASATLPAATVYTSHLYTAPQYRGMGVATQTKAHALRYLRDCGFQRVFIVIAAENAASQAVSKKFGFTPYQFARYQKFSSLQRYRVKDYDSARSRTFWNVDGRDSDFWKAFSRIEEF